VNEHSPGVIQGKAKLLSIPLEVGLLKNHVKNVSGFWFYKYQYAPLHEPSHIPISVAVALAAAQFQGAITLQPN
jgi:hypothetical protein